MFTALSLPLPTKLIYIILAQGQFYIGAIIAVASSLYLQDILPGWLALLITLILTLLGSGLWADL